METSNQVTDESNRPALFLVRALRPLEPPPPTQYIVDELQDLVDALADPEIMNSTPGILSIIADWIEIHSTCEFLIRASSTETFDYPVSDMITSLRELPSLIAWLAANCSSVFCFDIDQQGRDLRVEFSRSGSEIQATCIQDHWQSAIRITNDEKYSVNSIRQCCKAIAQEFARAAIMMNANIEKLPKFREWCSGCGYELESD